MILSIVIVLVVGLIAYIHYLGGLLSGLISAVLALIATVVAMSYYEPLADTLSGGKFNDTAQGICLLALFALVYLLGRLLFDKLVPGNIRLPHLVDGIGGAVCGLIAGLFAAGIVALALQSMPFNASIAGYSRYPLAGDRERSVSVPSADSGGRAVDRLVIDELRNSNLEKDASGLLIPVDDIVVGFTKHMSSTGSLENGKPFESVHPDLLQEFFGQRLGMEIGAKHTASNAKGAQVEVVQINVLPKGLTKKVGEFDKIWTDPPKGPITAEPGHILISVSVLFRDEAADEDHVVRLSPASVRLVTKAPEANIWKNNFPIGTVQGGQAWMNKPDDFMFVDVSKGERGANFLFEVDDTVFTQAAQAPAPKGAAAGKSAAASYALQPGAFIEIKRLAKIPLDDVKVQMGLPPNEKKFIPMRKTQFYKEDDKAPETPPETPRTAAPGARTETPPPSPAPSADNGWAEAPLEKPEVVAGNALPVGINVGTADADADVVTTAASGHITARKFDALDVDTSNAAAALSELPKGGFPVTELMAPAGKRMVQVKLALKAGADSWAWAARLGDFTVVDGAGVAYKPSGVFAVVAERGGGQKLLASYKAAGEVNTVNRAGGTVTEVTLIYLLPADQKAKAILYQAKAGGLPLEP